MNIFQKSIKIIREEGVKKFAYKVFRWIKRKTCGIFLPFTLLSVKLFKPETVEDGIKFVYNSAYGLEPAQVRSEIMRLSRIFVKFKPKTIMEIGTAKGGTLFLFTKFALEDALIISIDLLGGPFGGGYPIWKIPIFKAFVRDRQKIYLLRIDSHNKQTLEKVKRILGKQKLDFLFIDGDHTYEGVKKDFEMYSPLVRKGGIIAFHDIVLHPPETGCEVNKLWRQIKKKYKHKEIVENWKQKWAGIGIVYV